MPAPSPGVEPALQRVLSIWVEFARASVDVVEGPRFQALEGLSYSVHEIERGPIDRAADELELYELVKASPLFTQNVVGALQDLLRSDPHLTAACRTTWGLARALEVIALDAIAQKLGPGSTIPDPSELAPPLIQRLFESHYTRTAYFHLFNVDVDVERLELPFGWELVRLSTEDAALLLNERTFTSRLHSDQSGHAFLRFVSTDTDGDTWEWLQQRWVGAGYIVRVLKYVKYGTIDLDWAGFYFNPVWVNDIWKLGVTILGRPRLDIQPQRFTITSGDMPQVHRYVKFYMRRLRDIDDPGSTFRTATAFAGDYYERHHERTTSEDQLIDLVVSLEALFSPGRDGEMSFRIAQRAALLLGATVDDRQRVFKLLRRAYEARSQLVHGDGSPFLAKKKPFTDADLSALGELVRIAILRLSVLHLRGHRDRNRVRQWLDDAALDGERMSALHNETDVERYLVETEDGRST